MQERKYVVYAIRSWKCMIEIIQVLA